MDRSGRITGIQRPLRRDTGQPATGFRALEADGGSWGLKHQAASPVTQGGWVTLTERRPAGGHSDGRTLTPQGRGRQAAAAGPRTANRARGRPPTGPGASDQTLGQPPDPLGSWWQGSRPPATQQTRTPGTVSDLGLSVLRPHPPQRRLVFQSQVGALVPGCTAMEPTQRRHTDLVQGTGHGTVGAGSPETCRARG